MPNTNEHTVLMLGVVGIAIIAAGLIIGLIFVCTYHARKFKSLKKPVKTTGIIDDVYVLPADDGPEPIAPNRDYYIITYSYTDSGGVRRTNKLKWLQNIGEAGDKIVLYFDSQNPQNSIADCQLKYGKGLWWKALIVLAVIIVPAIIIGFYFGK